VLIGAADFLRRRFMQTVVGIFSSRSKAEDAVRDLLQNVLPDRSIIFLAGQQTEARLASLPTTDAESDGMGEALGAVVGAAVGAGAGFALGGMAVSLAVPGVGPILAAGLGAAALLGLGGAAVGAGVGEASETAMDEGVPRDDVDFYRELLRGGRSLVVAEAHSDTQAEEVRAVLEKHGAEDTEDARKAWRSAA
jgi:hypothetical protein